MQPTPGRRPRAAWGRVFVAYVAGGRSRAHQPEIRSPVARTMRTHGFGDEFSGRCRNASRERMRADPGHEHRAALRRDPRGGARGASTQTDRRVPAHLHARDAPPLESVLGADTCPEPSPATPQGRPSVVRDPGRAPFDLVVAEFVPGCAPYRVQDILLGADTEHRSTLEEVPRLERGVRLQLEVGGGNPGIVSAASRASQGSSFPDVKGRTSRTLCGMG